MKAFRRAWGGWVAHAASLLLFAQLFATGFAGATQAGAPQLDAFGNVLCLSGEPGDDPRDSGRHALPDCCTSGCTVAAAHPAIAPDDATGLVNPAAQPPAARFAAVRLVRSICRTGLGNPRAPPLNV